MNLQERLLQSEIKHLGQIIQTLSYELIVLQDFLKEEYGPKFERFRKSYAGSSASSSSQSQKRRKETSIKHERLVTKAKDDSSLPDNNEKDNDNGMQIEDSNDSDTNNDSDSDTSLAALRDPLDTESNEDRKGGRKKTMIWKYFDKITHKDNKFSARCHICRSLVSSRASRMVEHRLKCKQTTRMKPLRKQTKKNYAEEVQKEMTGKDEQNDDGVDPREFSDEDYNPVSDNDSSGEDRAAKRSGRNLDKIWSYYEIMYQNHLRKAKCMSCGQFVSPKAVRMRQHKINCKGPATRTINDGSHYSGDSVDDKT